MTDWLLRAEMGALGETKMGEESYTMQKEMEAHVRQWQLCADVRKLV